MVKSEHKRQQKLSRKQAKDRKRHKSEIEKRQSLASLHGQMLHSAKGSLVFCGVTTMAEGMVSVVVARRAPNGLVGMMCLLVDTFCLGVKDSLGGIGTAEQLRDLIEKTGAEPCEPALARGVVESAVEFAARAGLQPHPDYRNLQPLWGDIERGSIDGVYAMGMDGKHCYMNGPFDDAAKQRFVLNSLRDNLGEGNFNYMLGTGPMDMDKQEFWQEEDVEMMVANPSVEYRRLTVDE